VDSWGEGKGITKRHPGGGIVGETTTLRRNKAKKSPSDRPPKPKKWEPWELSCKTGNVTSDKKSRLSAGERPYRHLGLFLGNHIQRNCRRWTRSLRTREKKKDGESTLCTGSMIREMQILAPARRPQEKGHEKNFYFVVKMTP